MAFNIYLSLKATLDTLRWQIFSIFWNFIQKQENSWNLEEFNDHFKGSLADFKPGRVNYWMSQLQVVIILALDSHLTFIVFKELLFCTLNHGSWYTELLKTVFQVFKIREEWNCTLVASDWSKFIRSVFSLVDTNKSQSSIQSNLSPTPMLDLMHASIIRYFSRHIANFKLDNFKQAKITQL